LKSLLNKVALAAGVVALSMSSVNGAADNEIIITGDVSSSMVVGFADVSGEAAAAGRFVGADIALGTVLPGADFTTSTQNIYVNSNSATGVQIKVDDAAVGAGVLVNGANTIPVAYSFGSTGAYTVDSGTYVSLTATTSAGSAIEDTFIINPDVTAGGQAVGTYSVTLNVTVAAN